VLSTGRLAYKISPKTGEIRSIDIIRAPKFGIYKTAFELPFPGEFNFDDNDNGQ